MTDSSVTGADAVTRRREWIAIARRRAQPGAGSPPSLFQQRTWREPVMDLRDLTVPYVLVGGMATWLYMAHRPTDDTDILIRAADAARCTSELRRLGGTWVSALGVGGTSWKLPDGSALDVLESSERWADDAIQHPNRSPTGLPVVALPYLVLMKLQASRSTDVGDISRMLGQADEATRKEVRAVVRTHRPEDLDDLESLIILGDLELADVDAAEGD